MKVLSTDIFLEFKMIDIILKINWQISFISNQFQTLTYRVFIMMRVLENT